MINHIDIRVLPEYGSVYEITIELDESAKETIVEHGKQFYIDNWVAGNLINVKEYEESNFELDSILSQIDIAKITDTSRIVIYVAKVGVAFMCCLDIIYDKDTTVTLAMKDLNNDDLSALIAIAKKVCNIYPDLCFSFPNGIDLVPGKEGV